jgi:hypothetical protein
VICRSCGGGGSNSSSSSSSSSSSNHHRHRRILFNLSGVMSVVYSSHPAHALIPVDLRLITNSSSCVCIILTHGVTLFLHCRILRVHLCFL